MEDLGKIPHGKTYLVTDKRPNGKKPLDKLVSITEKAKVVPIDAGAQKVSSVPVVDVPLSEIQTATSLFQNRKREYSHRTVNRILTAVKNGTFSWAAFDPITLWRNPENNTLYVLSGHSRTEAFRQLAEKDAEFEGRGFDTIPAKITDGTLEEARELALNSNTLADRESDIERAAYYRNLRESGRTDRDVLAVAKDREGKDGNRIFFYSFLSPEGRTVAAMDSTEESDPTTRNTVSTVAAWIGSARKSFPQLTDAHENELFEWLIYHGGYGTQGGQVSNADKFRDKVSKVVQRNTENGRFQSELPLNLKNTMRTGVYEAAHAEALRIAEKEVKEAATERDAKRADFVARQKGGGYTDADIIRALKPYDEKLILAQRAYLEIKSRAGQVQAAERAQQALFGLGAVVEIKTPLEEGIANQVKSSADVVLGMIKAGIPIDHALSTVKKFSGLNREKYAAVVALVQKSLQVFNPDRSRLNGEGLGNPALTMAAKEAAIALAPFIIEEAAKLARQKMDERKTKKKKGLGDAMVLAENSRLDLGIHDGISKNGMPIWFGGMKPTYKVLPSYDHLITKSTGVDIYHGDRDLSFVLEQIQRDEKGSRNQVRALAKHLYSPDRRQAAFNIWHFLKTNVRYELENDELLRLPARSWADRHTPGVDCDDYSIFAAALAKCMGYTPLFKVVAFKKNYQHIYVVMDGIVIDPVLDYFGADPKNITRAMHVHTLGSIPTVKGAAKLQPGSVKNKLAQNLARARANRDTAKERVYSYVLGRSGKPDFVALARISHLIADVDMSGRNRSGFVWKKDIRRFSPAELELVQQVADATALGEVEGILCDRYAAMEGLGKLSKSERSKKVAAQQKKTWDKKDKKKNARQQKRVARIKKKNPNRAKKVEANQQKRNQRVNERREANKGVPLAKRVGRAFARFDPLAATGRGSFIAVVKLNFRGLATNMSWGILPDDVLRKNGLNDSQIKNVRAAWDKLSKRWADIGGNPGMLRDAIKSGYRKKPFLGQGKKGKAKGPKVLSGLGGVTKGDISAALQMAAAKGYLDGMLAGLGGLGAAPAIAAAITAAAAVIGMIGGLVSQVVKAAGKKDAAEGAVEGEAVEYPEGEVPPVTEEEMYEGADDSAGDATEAYTEEYSDEGEYTEGEEYPEESEEYPEEEYADEEETEE